MSKKLFKRSLALGALMAFVITGSAMAADINYEGNTYTIKNGTIEGADSVNITTSDTGYYGVYGYSGEFTVGDLTINSNSGGINLQAQPSAETTQMTINADDVTINTKMYSAIYNGDANSGSTITLNIDNKLDVDGRQITVTGVDKNLIVNAKTIEADLTYTGILSYGTVTLEANDIDIATANGQKVVWNYKNVNLQASNDLDITGEVYHESGTTNLSGVNTTVNGDVKTVGSGTVNVDGVNTIINGSVLANGSITVLNGSNDLTVNGCIEALKKSQVNLKGNTITVDDTNGKYADAVYAQDAQINLGEASTNSIVVKNAGNAIRANKNGSLITVKGNELNVFDVTKNGKKAIYASNSTIDDNDSSDNARVVLENTVTRINTYVGEEPNGSALCAFSQGIIDVKSDLYATAKRAILTRGGATVNINTEEKNKVVQLTGDIWFAYDEATSGTPVDANVNVNLTNPYSFFDGKIIVYGDKIPVGYNEVTGMNIELSGGATWKVTGESIVNKATFGADAIINLGDGELYNNANENAVYALKAGDLNEAKNNNILTVDSTAKLQIDNIKETTYNIATGFENYDKVAESIDIVDNALLQANKFVNKENKTYQVKIEAKKADQMAADTGISTSTAELVQSIIEGADNEDKTPAQEAAVEFIENVVANNPTDAAVGNAINAATKMGEAGGNSATAASIVKNVTGVTNDRLSFNCGHSAPHKGGHGVGLFEEGSGADIWVEYVHGKDKVEDMPSTAGASSYEGQYNGIVMGVDFKKVNKFQSGIAFNYGEGDTNSVGNAVRTHSDYDFWGVGYYGSIHNDDSNVIFDINYAQTDSDVTQYNSGSVIEASPETTTWSAGVKLEKLYQNENVQIVPYTGLRYMSIDADDYSTKKGEFYYSMDRQDIWLLPLGVSIKQEVTNDNGWTVSPRVDLSYIWAFGDTNSNMEVKSPFAGVSQLGYDVMDDGSFLGLVGIEAHKGQWGYGIAYSYQKGDHSESKKWFVDVNYSF